LGRHGVNGARSGDRKFFVEWGRQQGARA
jgi:hypothetical protein